MPNAALPSAPDDWITALTADPRIGGKLVGRHGLDPGIGALDAVICIPVRDEESLLPACLAPLVAQAAAVPSRVGLVVGVNNSRDGSLERAGRVLNATGLPFLALQAEFPAERAGAPLARRWTMEIGAHLAALHGTVLTTDADSTVRPGWLAANLAAIAAGADAVCGLVRADAAADRLVQMNAPQRRLEWRYRQALLHLAALVDPDPLNPWPHHGLAAGPSLAVRRAAYRAIGGLPTPPFAEDKALVARLRAAGFRIRFSSEAVVETSCRLQGRASQGFADFLQARAADPDSWSDEWLEPVATAWLRATSRARLRAATAPTDLAALGQALCLSADARDELLRLGPGERHFGPCWALIERHSVLLQPQRLRPSEIRLQLPIAERLVQRIMPAAALPADPVTQACVSGAGYRSDSGFDARCL